MSEIETEGGSKLPPVLAPVLPQDQPPLYFPVSVNKLVVMSIFTGGIYQIYWFYKNWQLIKDRERSSIIPFLRAFFSIFFCYDLFKRITNLAQDSGFKPIASGPLAAGWIFVSWILGFLPQPLMLVSVLSFFFLIPVQEVVNQINNRYSPDIDPNIQYSGLNFFWMGVGAFFLLLILLGFGEAHDVP